MEALALDADVRAQPAGVFSYMLSSLQITQTVAETINTLDVNRWVLRRRAVDGLRTCVGSFEREEVPAR